MCQCACRISDSARQKIILRNCMCILSATLRLVCVLVVTQSPSSNFLIHQPLDTRSPGIPRYSFVRYGFSTFEDVPKQRKRHNFIDSAFAQCR